MGKRCASCKHFDIMNKAGEIMDAYGIPLEEDQGECRKNPPVVCLPNDLFDSWFGRWPGVRSSDFCGQHEEIEAEPNF